MKISSNRSQAGLAGDTGGRPRPAPSWRPSRPLGLAASFRPALLRDRDVDQHGPGVGNIEGGGRQPGVPGVCLDDLDVRQTSFGHHLPRHGDVDRVDLESYDAAPGADALGEQLEDSSRAASDVDRALSLSGADSVENSAARGWSSMVCLRNRSASACLSPAHTSPA